MFAIERLSDVDAELTKLYRQRLSGKAVPEGPTVRGPIGLSLIRDDGAAMAHHTCSRV